MLDSDVNNHSILFNKFALTTKTSLCFLLGRTYTPQSYKVLWAKAWRNFKYRRYTSGMVSNSVHQVCGPTFNLRTFLFDLILPISVDFCGLLNRLK